MAPAELLLEARLVAVSSAVQALHSELEAERQPAGRVTLEELLEPVEFALAVAAQAVLPALAARVEQRAAELVLVPLLVLVLVPVLAEPAA